MSEHITKHHNKTLLLYHLVCPVKYRKKALTEPVEQALKQVCLELQKRYELRFIEIGADQDHVHFLIQSVPVYSPTKIARIVKSITAREIFKPRPEVKEQLWRGEFWTAGYFINGLIYLVVVKTASPKKFCIAFAMRLFIPLV